MSRVIRRIAVVCALLLLVPTIAAARSQAPQVVIQDIDLSNYPRVGLQVVVPGALAQGETPVFAVKENGRATEVLNASVRKTVQSVDAVLVLDTSGSMEGASLEAAKSAAAAFIDQLEPPSRAALVVFSDRPRLLVPMTDDVSALKRAVRDMGSGGETALYDAVLVALRQVSKGGTAQPVVVVLSDGGDTASRASLSDAMGQIRTSRVPVLAVALSSKEADPGALRMLARVNAGKVTRVEQLDQLTSHYAGLARELQTRFAVVFSSNRPSTMDLDIEVTATGADAQAAGDVVVKNPAAAYDGPLEDTIEPVPAENLVTYGLSVILVFAAVALLVAALALVMIRPSTGLSQLKYYDQSVSDSAAGDSGRDRVMGGVMSAIDAAVGKGGYKRLAYDALERAGLPLRPTEFMSLHVAVVVISGLVVGALSRQLVVSILVAIAATVLPLLWLSGRGRKRLAQFEAQLPDTLDLIAGSLRAGWGLQQALEAVVDQSKPPISDEFKRVQTEVRLGRSVDEALESVAARMKSRDFDWVVSAISIQREVGGNLAELLTIVARTIRERAALQRQVNSLTAEGRLSATILFILPFFEAAVLFIMNPTYVSKLLAPGMGIALLATGIGLLIVGAVWLGRVIRVEV